MTPSNLHAPASAGYAPAIFVFEKRPRWSTELKRHLSGRRIFIRSHTTAREIPVALARFPASLVVLDLESDLAACLAVLRTVHEEYLAAKFIAVTHPSLAELEWPLREAGVTVLVPDTIRGEELAKACLRTLQIEVGPAPQSAGY